MSVWPRLESWVLKSCVRGGGKFLPIDYLQAIIEREMQLWVAGNCEAFAITEIIKYPRKKILRINMGGGNYKRYFKEFIETASHGCGCDGAEAVTREGYLPLFKAIGWKKTQIFVEQEF
jgi:hypothetical protein